MAGIEWAPYLTRMERDREGRAARAAGVANASNILAQTMEQTLFAYRQDQERKAKAKLDFLGLMGPQMGWPDPLLNEYAGAVDNAVGPGTYPRDDTGKPLKPPRSLEQQQTDFWNAMPPEQQHQKLLQDWGLALGPKDKADEEYKKQDLAAKQSHYAAIEQIDRLRLEVERGKAKKGEKGDELTGWSRNPDPKGTPIIPWKPGMVALSRNELADAAKANGINSASLTTMEKEVKINTLLGLATGPGTDASMLRQIIGAAAAVDKITSPRTKEQTRQAVSLFANQHGINLPTEDPSWFESFIARFTGGTTPAKPAPQTGRRTEAQSPTPNIDALEMQLRHEYGQE